MLRRILGLLAASFPFGAAVVLASTAPAQLPDFAEPGAYPTGWLDVTVPSNEELAEGRIFYPALEPGNAATPDSASGPYPLTAWMHGFGLHSSDYDSICEHVASHGWMVVSLGTEDGTVQVLSSHVRDLMNWLNGESATTGAFFEGTVSTDHVWAAGGHSYGGRVMQRLFKKEPKIRVGFALTPGFDIEPNGLPKYTGSLLVMAGAKDVVTPPDEVSYPYFQTPVDSRRAVYVEVKGMGHGGPLDPGFPEDVPMPYEVAHRWSKELSTAFLYSEVLGTEDAFTWLLGEKVANESYGSVRESRAPSPPLWAATSTFEADTFVGGLAGRVDDTAFLLVSPSSASIETPFGLLGVDPDTTTFLFADLLGASGYTEVACPLPEDLSGLTVHLQALRIGTQDAAFSVPQAFLVP